MYNVNKGYNKALMKRSETLNGYVTLVSKARGYEDSGMDRASAVHAAVKDCIELGILTDYHKKYASEVVNMLLQEWKWDDARAVWEKEAAEREGRKWQSIVADKDVRLADKDAVIADKDVRLADKDAVIADKDAVIADKDAIIVELRAKLGLGNN